MAKEKKEFNINDYIQSEKAATPNVENKQPEFLIMPEPVQKGMSMPGFPLGHMSMMYGLSDSGKTGLLLDAVKRAQQQGILPVLIVTENKLNKKRIQDSGVDLDKLILVDNLKYLETVYDYISCKTQEVLMGKLPMNVMMFWDSVAGCPSKDSFEIKADGKIEKNFDNRKNANVIGFYNNIIASRIAETRKVGCLGTVGVVFVTQAYIGEKPKFPPGLPAPIIPNGGEKIWFPLSLALEVKEGKKLHCKHNNQHIEYGLVTKIKTKKNHINSLNCEGEVVLAGSQLFANDADVIEEFKKTHQDEWTQILESALVNTEEGEE